MRGRLLASTALVAGMIGTGASVQAQTAFQGPGSPPATTQNLPPAPGAPPAASAPPAPRPRPLPPPPGPPPAPSAAQGPRFVIRLSGFFTSYVAGVWQDDRGSTGNNAGVTATTGTGSTSPEHHAR